MARVMSDDRHEGDHGAGAQREQRLQPHGFCHHGSRDHQHIDGDVDRKDCEGNGR